MQSLPTPPPVPRPAKSDWFSRNWVWFVPMIVIGLVLLAGGALAGVFGMMKSSDAYKNAVARANADPRVISALGAPVKEGMLMTGNINITNDTGNANLAIPISGPQASGTLYAIATKAGGVWTFSTLAVQVEGSGQKIDLLQSGTGGATPPH